MGWMLVFIMAPISFIFYFFPAVGYVLVLGWTSESFTERFRENSLGGSVRHAGGHHILTCICLMAGVPTAMTL